MTQLFFVGASPVIVALLAGICLLAVVGTLPAYPARVRRFVGAASVAIAFVVGATVVRAADSEPKPEQPILDPCDALPEPYRTICEWLP